MNIYVETNFVLEIVFEQEEAKSCEDILVLCEQGQARLVIPTYCLAEPHEKLTRQASIRKELQRLLNDELRQLRRTPSYNARIKSIEDVESLLAQSSQEEQLRFRSYRERLLDTGGLIPLTTDILRAAASFEELYDLTPQDAVVYASVITQMRENAPVVSCFLNRNKKDFYIPSIVAELDKHLCKMIPSFDDGLAYIRSQLGN